MSRIKPHTDYRGPYESGITKMCVIGLGKREGASQHHRWGWKGLQQMLVESAKVILEKTKVLGGLAILENSHEETGHLQVVDRDELLAVEPVLLERSRSMMGRLASVRTTQAKMKSRSSRRGAKKRGSAST